MSSLLTPGVLQQQANGSGKQYALSFDGVDDYGVIKDSISINIYDKLSISVWIKPFEIDINNFLGKFREPDYQWILRVFQGNISFWLGGNWHTGNISITNNEWHNVIVTFDDANDIIRLYVNNFFDSEFIENAIIQGSSDITFGARFVNSFNYEGLIDDIRIFNKIINSEEREFLFNNKYKKLGYEALFLPINDGEGSTVNDLSDNGNNGTIYGAQWIEL